MSSESSPAPLYTTADVARILDVSMKTVWLWTTQGRTPIRGGESVKLASAEGRGRNRRYSPEAVKAFRERIATAYRRAAAQV